MLFLKAYYTPMNEVDKKNYALSVERHLNKFVLTFSLQEYVMVMVANHKSKGQVASDLEAFLGPDKSQTFTTWLWDALNAMNSGRLALHICSLANLLILRCRYKLKKIRNKKVH
jgi:hypothetical protein